MPYYDNRRQKWTGQYRTREGKKRTKSFKTKKEARQWEVKQETAIVDVSKIDTVSLAEWTTEYLDYSKKKFVDKTYKGKVKALKGLMQFNKLKAIDPVDTITPLAVAKFLEHINETQSGGAANNYRKDISAAWNWGIKYLSITAKNPVSITDKLAEKKKPKYLPPLSDFWAVYDVCYCEQDKNMLLTYLHTAARKDEVFRLRWADVDFFQKQIRLWCRKNRIGEWIGEWLPMTGELNQVMQRQHKLTGTEKNVFIDKQSGKPFKSRQRFMDRSCAHAQVKPFTFGSIRHLTASVLAEQGVPTVTIQTILRHANLSTTDNYIRNLGISNRECMDTALPRPGQSDIGELKQKGQKMFAASSGPNFDASENSSPTASPTATTTTI